MFQFKGQLSTNQINELNNKVDMMNSFFFKNIPTELTEYVDENGLIWKFHNGEWWCFTKDKNGNWHQITTDPGTIIVNIGDMLKEVSGGYYPSTTHRVVNPSSEINNDSRYSMPLFLHPRDEVKLSKNYTADTYLKERLLEIGLKS